MTSQVYRIITTRDGLSLAVAHYSGGPKTPVLCIPGLTRNAADFDQAAPLIAATGRDVYAISLRGRGRSSYDPNYLNYHPLTYRTDVVAALDKLGLARAVFVGTSLGGIVAMLTAQATPERVAGAVINDIGPELAPEGIARILGYVGGAGAAPDLDAAAAQIRAVNEVAFPGRNEEFWRRFARRTFRQETDGSWRLDYDPMIGKALQEAAPAPDLWPAFATLAGIPTLVIRGVLSDLLSPDIVEKMQAVRPGFEYCEVADVGHAPTLIEPDALRAMIAFINTID